MTYAKRLFPAAIAATLIIALACAAPAFAGESNQVQLQLSAKLQYDGWQDPVGSGKTAGTNTKQGLRMMKAALSCPDGITGSIRYRTYTPGEGWSATAKDGAQSGSTKRAITAAKVWLAGGVAKRYDVYCRVYMKGFGWLGWAKAKEAAGTLAKFAYVNAMQVKLVKKGSTPKGGAKPAFAKDRWAALEAKYLDKAQVNQLLEVRYTGGHKAKVLLRQKQGAKWTTALSCKGYVGKAGIGKASMYSTRTPSGDFGITKAFGIKKDPGAKLPYVKVNKYMYWCGDRSYYNQLVDIRKKPHDCDGEHLIDIKPYYNYGLFFDYNTNPVKYGAGSAFFVHAKGPGAGTDGCIAVSSSNMVKIIQTVEAGSRLLVYRD